MRESAEARVYEEAIDGRRTTSIACDVIHKLRSATHNQPYIIIIIIVIIIRLTYFHAGGYNLHATTWHYDNSQTCSLSLSLS